MKVSIITVNLNNASGLTKTINSVLTQTFKDFEWIIIDGGSTDNSVELIRQYSQYLAFWESSKDSGIYDAMNKGIERAQGEYCFFLNSGDSLSDERVLEKCSCFLSGNDIVSGYVLTSSGELVAPPPSLCIRYLYHHNIPHQAEFIHRRLFIDIGLYSKDLKILADYEFNLKSALCDVPYSTFPLQVSVVEEGGISSKDLVTIQTERDLIFKRLLPTSILEDYQFWLNPLSYAHPSVTWLLDKPFLMKIIKRFIRR